MGAALDTCGGFSLLWRFGGHPTVPPASVMALLLKAHRLSRDVRLDWPLIYQHSDVNLIWAHVDSTMCIDSQLKRNLVEAVATVRCLPLVRDGEMFAELAILSGIIEKAEQALAEQRDAGRAEVSEDQAVPVFSHRTTRIFEASLYPVYDICCVQAEQTALVTFSNFLLGRLADGNSDRLLPTPVTNSVSLLQAIIPLALRRGTRAITGLAATQELTWQVDATREQGTLARSVGVLYESLVAWHTALWQNAGNHYFQFCNLPKLLLMHKAAGLQHVKFPIPLDTAVGPASLFCSPHAKICSELLHDWSLTSLRDVPLKIEQISELNAHFTSWSPPTLEPAANLEFLTRHVWHMLIAHTASFDSSDVAQLAALYVRFGELCSDGNPADDVVDSTLSSMVEVCARSTDRKLSTLAPSLFAKLLRALLAYARSLVRSPAADQQYAVDLGAVGRAWALLGLFRYHLLLPSGPLDPTAKHARKLKQIATRIVRCQQEISIRCFALKNFTGADSNYEVAKLRSNLTALQREHDAVKLKVVDRPTVSQYPQIYELSAKFGESLGSIERVTEMLFGAAEPTRGRGAQYSEHQEKSWQENSAQLVERLQAHENYPDITTPLCLAIYEIKLGVRLHMHAAQRPTELASHSLAFLPPCSMSIPWRWHASDVDTAGPIDANIEAVPAVQAATASLMVCLHVVRFKLLTSLATTDKGAMLRVLHQTIQRFGRLWAQQEERRKQKELQAAQAVKYRTKEFHIESDDERQARILSEMFPDFAKEFGRGLNLDNGPEEVEPDEPPEEAAELKGASGQPIGPKQMADFYDAAKDVIAAYHSALAGSAVSKEIDGGLRVIELAHQAIRYNLSYAPSSFQHEQPWEGDIGAYMCLGNQFVRNMKRAPLALAAFSTLHSKSNDPKAKKLQKRPLKAEAAPRVNVYQDGIVGEANLLQRPLAELITRLDDLLRQFPEQPILEQLMMLAKRVEDTPVGSPLMRFMTGLELLVQKAHEWEKYAARHVSIKVTLAELQSLMARWRRVELYSWSHVLDTKAAEARSASAHWFVRLVSLLVFETTDVTQFTESVKPGSAEGAEPASAAQTPAGPTAGKRMAGIVESLEIFLQARHHVSLHWVYCMLHAEQCILPPAASCMLHVP